MRHRFDLLMFVWMSRRCWICEQFGNCGHRELAVDSAELELALRRDRASFEIPDESQLPLPLELPVRRAA